MREVPNQELFTQRRLWKRVLYYVRIAEQIRDYLHSNAYGSVCCIIDPFGISGNSFNMMWGRGRQAHHKDEKKKSVLFDREIMIMDNLHFRVSMIRERSNLISFLF